MKSMMIRIIVFVLMALFASCTDVVDVDVPDGGDRLVVEASILWEKGTAGQVQTISLRICFALRVSQLSES